MSDSSFLNGMAVGEFFVESIRDAAKKWLEEREKVILADELIWKGKKLTHIQKESKRWFSKYRNWTSIEMKKEVEILWSKGDEYKLPGKYWIHNQNSSEKEKVEQLLTMANSLPETMYLSEIAVTLLSSKPQPYYVLKEDNTTGEQND